ncbi:hypothetical protein ACJTNI_00475 [Blastococcus deserti]
MTTTASTPGATVPSAPVAAVALRIAVGEARRIATGPLVLAGAGLYCAMVTVASGQGPGSGYDGLLTGPTFFIGVFTYFAAHLAASRPRRDGCQDEHTSMPAPAVARTAGLCLAAFGPALLSVALMGLISAWYAAGRLDLPVWPSAGELAAGPLTVVGGALLGVLVARWLPFPTAPVLVMVAVVATTLALNEGWSGRYALLSPYATFSVFVPDGSWGGHTAGSPAWHAVYLAALCGMAAAGAVLRDARRPAVPFVAGVASFLVAVVAGAAQLP